MNRPQQFNLAKAYFICTVALAVFALGIAVGAYKLFPYHQLKYMKESINLLTDEAGMVTNLKPTRHIFPAKYDGEGAITHDEAQISPGLTLVASFFNDGLEMQLLESSGKIVNRWPTRISEIWENLNHVQPPKDKPSTDWNAIYNGSLLLPDGSVVFNLKGLVKMDRCGRVLWKVPKMTHHSIEPATGGGFWVPSRRYISGETKHPPLAPPYFEETILKVSTDGVEMMELSILDLLIKNDLQGVLYSNNRVFRLNGEKDIVHLNDVEELTDDLASDFPQFKAGDLLVSIRQPNMIFVVDPETEVIKWHQVGPWIQQHDPDFQPDGKIVVFDNQFDSTMSGSIFGGSRIVELDTQTGITKRLYGGVEDQPMYTSVQGDHQLLENGNILIAEGDSGRVLEIDRNGHLVWEFINRYSDDEVYRVADATRYSFNYFISDNWQCDTKDN